MQASPSSLVDLIGADVKLKRVAVTAGGEWAGPCPFCRGGVDRFRVWPAKGRWWCRSCDRKGDDIEYVRERDGLGFRAACEKVGREAGDRPQLQPARREVDEAPPGDEWQARALSFIDYAESQLWETEAGGKALEYLRGRGLKDETIRRWGLGYNPEERKTRAEHWGLTGDKVTCARGIVIPCIVGGVVWSIKIRRPLPGDSLNDAIGDGWGRFKYLNIRGGRPAVFGCDGLKGKAVALMLEGEFDVMLVDQEAGDLAGVATLGSASYRLAGRWLWAMRDARRIVVGYDGDEAGEKGASALGAVSSRVRQARPEGGKDATEVYQAGGDLRAWVEGLIRELE